MTPFVCVLHKHLALPLSFAWQVIAKACPCAVVNIISNPVNSTVPIAAATFKKLGVYDPRRLLGVLFRMSRGWLLALTLFMVALLFWSVTCRRDAPGRDARPYICGRGHGHGSRRC